MSQIEFIDEEEVETELDRRSVLRTEPAFYLISRLRHAARKLLKMKRPDFVGAFQRRPDLKAEMLNHVQSARGDLQELESFLGNLK